RSGGSFRTRSSRAPATRGAGPRSPPWGASAREAPERPAWSRPDDTSLLRDGRRGITVIALSRLVAVQPGHDVLLAEVDELVVVHAIAAVLAEHHDVALADHLAVGSRGDDLAELRLVLGDVGHDDAPLILGPVDLDRADEDAAEERFDTLLCQRRPPFVGTLRGRCGGGRQRPHVTGRHGAPGRGRVATRKTPDCRLQTASCSSNAARF